MRNFIRKNRLYIIGALLGAVTGYLYYKFIGCASGTCAISSSPINSTIYFALMGAFVFGIFKKDNSRTTE